MAGRNAGRPEPRGWLALALIATFVAFFVRVGGDALAYYRMWLWVLPLLAILAVDGLVGIARAGRAGGVIAGSIAVLLIALHLQHSFVGRELVRLRRDEAFVRDSRLLGATLRTFPPRTLVAANNVGALAYSSGLPVLDMLGLNDRTIARAPGKAVGIPGHECHAGSYVLDRRPDLVFYGMPRLYPEPVPEARVRAKAYPSDQDLDRDARFLRFYRFSHVETPDGRYAPVYRRVAEP